MDHHTAIPKNSSLTRRRMLFAVGVTLLAMAQTQATTAQDMSSRFGDSQPTTSTFGQTAPGESTQAVGQENVDSFINTSTVADKSSLGLTSTTQNAGTSSDTNADSMTLDATSSEPGMASTFISIIKTAGPMMFAILACSVLLLMFVFERAISLRRRRVIPKHFVNLFLKELDDGQLKPDEALALCEENQSPISEVFAAAVKKWNRPSVEVEQTVLDAGERVANGLRRYLRLFNGIATISPLLGLLGTVLGMISAFNAIASSDAMGKPEVLASGISQALLTTAGGLSVAIPAFIAYMYFTSRVDRLIIEIDSLGQEAVTAIASDAWKAKSTRKSKSTAKAA